MSPQLVFLVGMPGVGKTYWGKAWSAHYGWQFIDLDEAIAKASQQTIPALFEEKGEAHFRQLESKMLLQAIAAASENTIIATGGGTVLAAENRKAMSGHIVVWLQAPVAYLISRLQSETNSRPLLAQQNLNERLSSLLEARRDFYAEAPLHLDATQLSVATFQILLPLCSKPH